MRVILSTTSPDRGTRHLSLIKHRCDAMRCETDEIESIDR